MKSSLQGNWVIYRRLLGYLVQYWKVFLISLVSMILAALTEPAFARLMKPLIDNGFVSRDPHALAWVPLGIVGVFMVRGVTCFINEYTSSWLAGQLVQTLREQMFCKMLRLPVQYYAEHQSGRLVSRISYDVTQVTEAGFSVITVTVKDGVTAISLLAWMFYIDWQLTLISLLVFPVVSCCVRVVGKRLRNLSRANQRNMAVLTQVLSEGVTCQQVIKVYGGKARENARFRQAAMAIRRNSLKQSTVTSVNTGVTQLMIASALATILYFATLRAQVGAFTAGDFMSFLIAMMLLFSPVKRITGIAQTMQRGLAAAGSVFDFLDLSEEPDHGRTTLRCARGKLQLRGVYFRYPGAEQDVLRDISLQINPGEKIALVGWSGSGKTTLVSLIPRFYDPDRGEIRLDDVPLQEMPLRDLRRQIAMVSQDVVLFNDSVAANIAYGDVSHSREALFEVARAANALDFIEALPDGFDTLIGENGVRLSGGQRQRLAIARALLKKASLLILDEATSALDSQSERRVQSALENLMKNCTTIVIAHRLSTIENADRIVVMHHGKIAEVGSLSELLSREGLYSKLHSFELREGRLA